MDLTEPADEVSERIDKHVQLSSVLTCAVEETKLLVKSVGEAAQKSLFCAPSEYQDLSTRHNWPFKRAIVQFGNKSDGNYETHLR